MATVMICPTELFVDGFFHIQQDSHVIAWRWKCYIEGNWHEWPRYSSRIVYGAREHRDAA